MDLVTQNQQTLDCELLTDSGQTVEDSNGHSDAEPTDGTWCGTTDFGQIVEKNNGHSVTETTDCTL
jgi:hypothetical protein